MITCLYCGYECPDTAQLCPNCGKPLVRVPMDKRPAAANSKETGHGDQAGESRNNHSRPDRLSWQPAAFYYWLLLCIRSLPAKARRQQHTKRQQRVSSRRSVLRTAYPLSAFRNGFPPTAG
ncbi:zinc-ribbon domain-containing protein [Sporomusa termitida]|uniref:zinc-ribbon domain-containing protein n=1 Tax=Sporomusa termitida TaxID=2377 RepID=UPI003CCC7E05